MHRYRVFLKVNHVTHSFKTRKQKATALELHGPSMYTLSMQGPQARAEGEGGTDNHG